MAAKKKGQKDMKRSIYKYPLDGSSNPACYMPIGARVLHVDCQNGVLCAWAVVDIDETETEQRVFHVFGTGHDIPRGLDVDTHISTVFDGPFVWHVFGNKP